MEEFALKDPIDNSEDLIRCEICGKTFAALSSHLRHKHQLTSDEYKEEFGVDHIVCASLRREISHRVRRRKLQFEPLDRAEVIRRLLEVADDTGRIGKNEAREKHPELLNQALHIFGSWNTALEAANLSVYDCQTWNKTRILKVIGERHAAGDDLAESIVQSTDLSLYNAARRYFGSWKAAIKAAGLDYSQIRQTAIRTEEAVQRELESWCREHGPVEYVALRESAPKLFGYLTSKYGTIEAAADHFTVPYHRLNTRWTRELVIQRFKKRIRERKSLKHRDMKREESGLYRAIFKHFKSIADLYEAVGLQPPRRGAK